jgi:predicted AlkP superfamily pyrophosphatase or phosphodiesterase
MKHSLYILFSLIMLSCSAQKHKSKTEVNTNGTTARPKIIVGITVDQMRYDYIERYWNDFGNRGFKRLVNEGFFARNLHYNYMPTITGPGHASIFTGSTPAYHGIAANDWYERSSNRMTYCASDSTATGVGTTNIGGKMSPHYLVSTTIGDELRLFSNKRSKVIGIALKDRGAILPAGRTADAAYWFIGADEGNWATSSWYMKELPQWVKEFNAKKQADFYLNQTWNTLLDASRYDESIADNNAYEVPYKSLIRPAFPYDLKELRKANGNFDLIKATPYGNSLTVDFALAAIEGEKLGEDSITDMICVSFSGTDYIGHQFGIHAVETQDCYLRLDQDLARLIDHLDTKFGRNNYLMFLSADHGGAPTPSYMVTDSASAGYWKSDMIESKIQNFLASQYGEGNWVLNDVNQNVYLNRKLIADKKLDLKKVQMDVSSLVADMDHVLMSFNAADLTRFAERTPIADKVQMGFNQQLSGDVLYVLHPDYMECSMQGTTHGAPFTYDTHVPALFFGFGVTPGYTFAPCNITDIAPTVTSICRLPLPSAAVGKPIQPLVK